MSDTLAVILLVLGMGAIGAPLIAFLCSGGAALLMLAGADEVKTANGTRVAVRLGAAAATAALAFWWIGASWIGATAAGLSLLLTLGFARPKMEEWEREL